MVSVNLIINTKYETIFNLILIVVFDIFAFIIFMICVHRLKFFNSIGTMTAAFGSLRFWMELIFTCGTCGLIDYFILCLGFAYKPTLAKILQRLVNERGKINEESNLPKRITDKLNKYKSYEQQKYHLETEEYKIPQNTITINKNDPVPINTIYKNEPEPLDTICETDNNDYVKDENSKVIIG